MNSAPILSQEGSQETAATMVGMLLGMVLARLTAGNVVALWVSFLLLTAFHMYGECLYPPWDLVLCFSFGVFVCSDLELVECKLLLSVIPYVLCMAHYVEARMMMMVSW